MDHSSRQTWVEEIAKINDRLNRAAERAPEWSAD
jgi:hypothetical protein